MLQYYSKAYLIFSIANKSFHYLFIKKTCIFNDVMVRQKFQIKI